MFEAEKIEKYNPLAEKMAKQVFGIIKDYAQYRREGAMAGKAVELIEKEIDKIESKQKVIITEETFRRVRDLVSEEFSKKGGVDATVSYILDLLSEIEKKRN
jgi:hypothetical protein